MLNIAKQEIDQTDLHLRYFTIQSLSPNILTDSQLSTSVVACCLQISKVHRLYRFIPSPATSHVLYLFNAEYFDTCLAKMGQSGTE